MSYTANTPWEQDSRALSATASIIDALGTSHILSGNISTMQYEASNASETISMGMCNAAKMQIEFKDVAPSDISAFVKGNKINFSLLAFAEIDGQTVTDEKEYPDMFIDTVETLETTHNDGNGNYYADITAVCYDAISKMDKKYSVYGFVPVHPTISDIVSDICDRFNLEASDNWDAEYIVDELPEDISYRQVLGYLAGLQGANAYINESGELDVKFYASTSKVITQAEQYMDGLAFGEEVNITVLESGTADNVLTVGSGNIGQTISFENPLMTQSLLQSIFNARIGQGLSYFPCNVKWKGNPHIDVGDIIKCQSKDGTEQTVLIMRKTLNYDGSLYEEYEAFAQPEKTIAFNNSPVLKRVKRELQSFEEAIIAATKAITQLDGSEYKLIPSPTEEGKAAGWCLKYGNSDNAIVATAGGIGFGSFQNGTFTANNAAIFFTDDGHGNVIGQINGNKIVAGSIDANAIAANAITASKIAAGSISSSKISADGITANKIIGGILQSSDGKTYFDLNNSLVRTVKSGDYQTTLGGGGVITETIGGGTVGGLVGSNNFTAGNSETLFFASRMFIGKSSSVPASSFDPYFDFYSDDIIAYKNIVLKSGAAITNGVYDLLKYRTSDGDIIAGDTSRQFRIFSSANNIAFASNGIYVNGNSVLRFTQKIVSGTKVNVTSSGSYISFGVTFQSVPKVICCCHQDYVSSEQLCVVNTKNITTSGFTAVVRNIGSVGTYGSDVDWIAIGDISI